MIFKVDERRFGLFEDDIARIRRYSDKALARLGNGGEEYDIRSFREYLSIPEDMYAAKPILIRPHKGRDLLTVDSIWKKRRVKTYDIFPTRFDYIKEVLIDNERIPVFNIPDLLLLDPPLESEALESIKNGIKPPADQETPPSPEEQIEHIDAMEGESVSAQEGGEVDSEKDSRRAVQAGGGGFSYVLLALSFTALFVVGFFIFRSEYFDELWPGSRPGIARSVHAPDHVLPYLSHQSRLQVQQNVYELLQKKKGELEEVETALIVLESEKNGFLRNMEERNVVFDEHISVFDVDESHKGLKSVVDFVRNKVSFKGEARRRSDHFLAMYKRRKGSLMRAKQEHELQLAELAAFSQDIAAPLTHGQPLYTEALYIDEAKSNRINRFLFLLERGDYDGSLKTLEAASVLPFSEEEKASQLLIRQLLVVLNKYGEQIELLEDNGPFDDIKLSYLNEDYGGALRKVRELEEEYFIKPLLSGLKNALYTNMEINRQIEGDIALHGKVTELTGKVAQLEKNGEYAKAIDIYESLLIFPLPSYDREYILNRVHSLWLEVELRRMKREENTKAIKYLESARILNREGNEKGAIEYYRMLLIECPHSDFVSDAVDEIMNLASM